MADDALDKLMAQLYAVAPELGPRRINEIAVKLRRDMGGGPMGYIRMDPQTLKAYELAESLAAGVGAHEAIRRAGISRATFYRLRRRALWVAQWREAS